MTVAKLDSFYRWSQKSNMKVTMRLSSIRMLQIWSCISKEALHIHVQNARLTDLIFKLILNFKRQFDEGAGALQLVISGHQAISPEL